MKNLLDSGADPNWSKPADLTQTEPITTAITRNKLWMSAPLTEALYGGRNQAAWSALMWACKRKNQAMASLLIDRGVRGLSTPNKRAKRPLTYDPRPHLCGVVSLVPCLLLSAVGGGGLLALVSVAPLSAALRYSHASDCHDWLPITDH